jgi:hypothetical protein|tara:strand:- start:333 stop:524 length:192 start_codon:yes stop_codon:yes gene_type:complete
LLEKKPVVILASFSQPFAWIALFSMRLTPISPEHCDFLLLDAVTSQSEDASVSDLWQYRHPEV